MSRQAEMIEMIAERVRIQLIGSMDLFMKWGKKSFKNTNDLKYEDSSKIIKKMAYRIANDMFNSNIRSKAGFEIDEEDVMANLKEGNVFSDIKLKPKLYKEEK